MFDCSCVNHLVNTLNFVGDPERTFLFHPSSMKEYSIISPDFTSKRNFNSIDLLSDLLLLLLSEAEPAGKYRINDLCVLATAGTLSGGS